MQQIIIRATHTQDVLGEKGRRIRELTSLVQKRFKFPEGSLELYAEKVSHRGLSAVAQCESLRYKLLGGLAVRRYVVCKSPVISDRLYLIDTVRPMVSFASSWNLKPRVAKSSSLESSVLLVPNL